MASVLRNATTLSIPFAPGTGGAWTRAGSRIWTSASHGTSTSAGIWAYYSDDEGATWTVGDELTGSASHTHNVCAVEVSGTWYLHGVYAPQSSTSGGLNVKLMSSNVASGTPGVFGSATAIDAGGSNLGVCSATMWATPTATNPRLWILARKVTASNTFQARLYYGPAGTGYTTAGNWANIANVGVQSGNVVVKFGVGTHWTVGGVDKCTVIVNRTQGTTTDDYISYTFDPTAATPALGTGTVIATMTTNRKRNATLTEGWFEAVTAKADYLTFGRQDGNGQSDWDLFRTVDGTTWTAPTGWNDLAAGRLALTSDGTNAYLIYNNTPGAAAAAASQMNYRTITPGTDALSAATVFSDNNAASLLAGSGTGRLWAFYRAGTSSPYSIRSDSVAISTGQTIAVGRATETSTATVVARAKVKATGRATETDTATVVARSKRLATGQSAEADTATVVARLKVRSTGRASEADTAQVITVVQPLIVAVGQAAETDTAGTTRPARIVDVGAAAETDTATTVGRAKIAAVTRATETDTATAAGRAKVRTVGAAAETDAATAVTRAKRLATGRATETDTATAAGRTKTRAANRATETDTATVIARSKRWVTGRAAETDTAQPISLPGQIIVPVGRATDTHTATPVTRTKRLTTSQAAETDTAGSATWTRTWHIGTASETDTGQSISRGAVIVPVGRATDTHTAGALTIARAVAVGVATETSVSTVIRWAKVRGVASAVEADTARSVVSVAQITLRPFTGVTTRPVAGTTTRPATGTTIRPSTGITVRPYTGTTARP